MATNIVVMGLPVDVKFPKLLNKFRAFFKRINIKMFWIRNTTEVEGSQQVIIELVSMADAKKAKNFLNNLPFRHEMHEYLMVVHMEEGGGEDGFPEEYERRRRPAKRNRPRSRSPGYRSEASKLDMEIELLRKQRQVIEEERRLLVEQKKLEMIREYGPSAARDFDHFDDQEPPRKKRQPEPVSKRPRPRSPIAKIPRMPKMARPKGLPVFFQPCKKLIGQMKPYIVKGTTPEEFGILVKLIRAAIRKELAITLEGQAFIPTVEIVKLYREKHPKEQDEAFVAKILAKIRTSCLTTVTDVEIKKEKLSDNETDAKGIENETNDKATENDTKDKENNDKGKEMGEEVADNETAPRDTANGDNETDAAAPDVAVAAETEPNTSQELEDISAGNLSEAVNTEIKTNDDTSVLDETAGDASGDGANGDEDAGDEALGDGAAEGDDTTAVDDALGNFGDEATKGDDWVEDWNTEETEEQEVIMLIE